MNTIRIIQKDGRITEIGDNKWKCNGLVINIQGDKNVVCISMSMNFLNSVININGCNCNVSIGKTKYDWPVIINMSIRHGDNQKIEIGENFTSGGTFIEMLQPNSRIKVGNDCMFSQDVTLQGGDGHCLFEGDHLVNYSEEMEIGNHVWVARNVVITKRAKVANGSVVGTGALVSSKFDEEFVVLGGNPAKIVKHNIMWDRESIRNHLRKEETKELEKLGNIIRIQGKEIPLHEFSDDRFSISCIGEKNVIELERNIKVSINGKVHIRIEGNNNHIHMGNNIYVKRNLFVGIIVGGEGAKADNCKIDIADKCFFNGKDIELVCGEADTNIMIGKDCLFAQNVSINTTDNHGIYDVNTGKRINQPESITIGSHVWLGRDALVLKGAKIGNNVIVGARCIVNKKFDENNVLIVGVPGKITKYDVDWKHSLLTNGEYENE